MILEGFREGSVSGQKCAQNLQAKKPTFSNVSEMSINHGIFRLCEPGEKFAGSLSGFLKRTVAEIFLGPYIPKSYHRLVHKSGNFEMGRLFFFAGVVKM